MCKPDPIIWIEKLDLLYFCVLFIRRLFSNICVFYDEHRVAKCVARLLRTSQWLRKGFKKFPWPAYQKDRKGFAIYYEIEQSAHVCATGFVERYLKSAQPWLRNLTKSWITSLIRPKINFILIVEHILLKEGVGNVIVIPRGIGGELLERYFENHDFILKQTYDPTEYVKTVLQPFYLLLRALLNRLFPRKVETNIETIGPSVWCEYNSGMIGRTTQLSFWINHYDGVKDDLVYSLAGKYIDLDHEIPYLNNKGYKWILCLSLKPYHLCRLTFRELFGAFLSLFRIQFTKSLLTHFFLNRFLLMRLMYSSIYRYYKVRVLIQDQSTEWFQEAKVQALDDAGGIMIGFHWSNRPACIQPIHLTPQHVYFVWGKWTQEWINRKGHSCKYILPSGLWITEDEIACSTIEFDPAVLFRITIFDSDTKYFHYQTPQSLSAFYYKLLYALEAHKEWAGILKSKDWDLSHIMLLPGGEEIVERIRLLIDQRRFAVLPPRTSPATAASLADLCVCYSFNSAGVVAGIHGYKAIHWDIARWLMHPIYRDPDQKLLFLSLEDLQQAIEEFYDGNVRIGDFSPYARGLNYFNDFNGPKRVAAFIKGYMNSCKKCIPREEALESAVDEYFRANAVRMSFYQNTNWYTDSL